MTGTLGLFSLVDLIQLLSGAGRTGRLLIRHPDGDARLYFEQGEIVHAVFGADVGEAAVFALFEDERGPFEFKAGLPAMERSIELGTRNLVLEATRRLDEARRDQGGPAPFARDVVPEVAGPVEAADVTLGNDEHSVLAQIDGRRSLERIADRCEMTFDAASRVVSRLVAADVVVVRKRRARTARLVVETADFRLPRGSAAVDATIVRAWTDTLGRRPDEVACRRESGRVVTFRLAERDAAGPYLALGRLTMLRSGMRSGEPLLVRPRDEGE